MTKTIAIILMTFLTSGCAISPKPSAPAVNMEAPVLIDRDLLVPCEKPQALEGNLETQIVAWLMNILTAYKACSDKNQAHIDLLQKHFPSKIQVKDQTNVLPK